MAITYNSLIKADSLLLLERMIDQSVDLVYLDPPWRSINDTAAESKDQYRNFIYKVLQQTQRVLKPSGNIFMYSRPDLNLDFGSLLVEVFGVENYVSEIVVPVKRYTNQGRHVAHETLFYYRMSEGHINNGIYKNSQEDIFKLFPKADSKGLFTYLSLFGPKKISSFNFEWNGIMPPDGYGWRHSKEKLDSMSADELLEIRNDKIYEKKYFVSENQLMPVGSLWDDIPPEIQTIKVKGTQSIKLLERVIKMGSNENQVVLDPFCGSGSMIEACLNLGRYFIVCDNSDKAIALCQERISDKYQDIDYLFLSEGDVLEEPLVWNDYTYKREEDEIADIIARGEGAFVEFKESACWNYTTSKKETGLAGNIMRSIASFLNTSGGVLLIGVKNDGSLRDLQLDFESADPKKRNRDGYELFLNNKIRELLGVEVINKYRISFFIINGSQICRITVEYSKEPIFLNEEFFIRANNQTVRLSSSKFHKYIMSRGEKN